MSALPGAAVSESNFLEDGLRLSMTNRLTRANRLAGAWWPYSTDLREELPALLTAIGKRVGSVRGVLLNRAEWGDTPLMSNPVGSGRLRIAWYGHQDEHTAIFIGDNAKRVELLLIPPQTDPREANAALRLAATMGNSLGAHEVLQAAADRKYEPLLDDEDIEDNNRTWE